MGTVSTQAGRSSHQGAAEEDGAYLDAVEKHVLSIIQSAPTSSFLGLLRQALGAYPGLVRDILTRHGYEPELTHQCSGGVSRMPELSPIRSEWYFTVPTAEKILGLADRNVLAVGVPTIAEAASEGKKAVTLVDNNPWISQRFNFGAATWHKDDFGSIYLESAAGDAILDPPWYFPDIGAWLHKALTFLRPGGRIFMPLLGQFTRPSAAAEREAVVNFASQYGSVQVLAEMVEYETPVFEQNALRAGGLPSCSCPWRRADLLVVTRGAVDRRPSFDGLVDSGLKAAEDRPDKWLEFAVRGQLISVRTASLERTECYPDSDPLVEQVRGVPGWTLNSVSARDSRCKDIEVWTSRNRVGVLRRPQDAARLLRELEGATSNSFSTSPMDLPPVPGAQHFVTQMGLQE